MNLFLNIWLINMIKRKGEIIREYRELEPRNDFIQFNLLNDTRFGLPKVYVNLFFFHPFMRPNKTKDFESDNYFFSIITYLSFINREINLNLTDAIRAGSTFNVYYSESFFYIDIFAYSDKIKKILEIIKKIIFSNKNEIFNKNNFAIYRDNALEDFSDIDRANIINKLKLEFFKILLDKNKNFPPIYNHYNFKAEKFKDLNEFKILPYINPPILYGFILGYYEESEVKKIYDSFSKHFNEANFKYSLTQAGYKEELIPIDAYKFVNYSLTKDDLNENKFKYINEIKEILMK